MKSKKEIIKSIRNMISILHSACHDSEEIYTEESDWAYTVLINIKDFYIQDGMETHALHELRFAGDCVNFTDDGGYTEDICTLTGVEMTEIENMLRVSVSEISS